MKKFKYFFLILVLCSFAFSRVSADNTDTEKAKTNAATETTADSSDGFALIPDGEIKGCDFKTGDMTFACIPNYLQYLIEIVIGIAGTIAVVFIMVGGFKYVFSGISEDKEAGKETIKNALLGLVIAGLSWVIVTWVISLLTM